VVDISADFRFRTASAYEAVYKHGHGAPARLAEFTCAVTGPATDNAVGVNIIQDQMGVRAVNAMSSGAALGDHLIESLGLGAKLAQAASE
jgi:hypothetical protein